MRDFRYRIVMLIIGLGWFYGMLVLVASAGANHGGSSQPTPSGSSSTSSTWTTTVTRTTTSYHGDPPPARSRIHYPSHLHSYARVRVAKGNVSPHSRVDLALLKRTKNGDCFWWHATDWVRSGCREVWRHLDSTAEGTGPWKWRLPRLRPSSGPIRFYTLFSFARYSGSPFSEGFEAGRNRIRFEIAR